MGANPLIIGMRIQSPSLEKLTLGYRFDQDREIVSLLFINYFLILLFAIVVVLLHASGETLVAASYRYHAFIFISLMEIWMIRKGLFKLARVLILILLPFLILILPPLWGIFDDEFYFWFPYVPIALSMIPHFILHTVRDRVALLVTLMAYFLLALLIDNLLIFLSDGTEKIIPFVLKNRFYYNLIPMVIYLFVNLAVGLVFANNYRYEQIMRNQQEELLRAEKMASMGTLTAGIAHEINNPLNFISGSLHAIDTLADAYLKQEGPISQEKEVLKDQIKKLMESSFEGVKRASDIVASLKQFANPGQQEKSLYDVEKLIFSALRSIEKKIPYYITVKKNIPAGMKVLCFEAQLKHVLRNILDNAIDAIEGQEGRDRAIIDISSAVEKIDNVQFSRISIGNNGPVIPAEQQKQIFDPFYTSKEAGKGIGMGMSVSYMIIREHKGRIEVRHENGNVVFDVILPLKPDKG